MPGGRFGPLKSILVPVDFSPVSRAVVTRAAALAEPVGARLVLLHVVQPPTVLADYDPALPVVETMVQAANRHLARLKALVEARGLTAEFSCHKGASPSHTIAEEAERLSADYIVMGSHGHGALYDLLVGSTTGGVLRRAMCPVVVVPSLQAARAKQKAPAEAFDPPGPLESPAQAIQRNLVEAQGQEARGFAIRTPECLLQKAQ